MSDDPNMTTCPLCGDDDIDQGDADDIEEGMEHDNKTCPVCGMSYWEVREKSNE